MEEEVRSTGAGGSDRGRLALRIVCILAAASLPDLASAQVALTGPGAGVGIETRLGERLPLALVFRDEDGKEVELRELFGARPVLLALVYYRCPILCTVVLEQLARTLRELPLVPGEDYDVVTVSIDPSETPALAQAKEEEVVRVFGSRIAAKGWRLLTGSQEAIDEVASAVGFRYRYDPETELFLHPGGFVVLTPDAVVSRYFYGASPGGPGGGGPVFSPRDVRLSLVEASGGKVGTVGDRVLLLCLSWNPSAGRYTLAVLRLVQVGAVLTLAGLGVLLWMLHRRTRDRQDGERT